MCPTPSLCWSAFCVFVSLIVFQSTFLARAVVDECLPPSFLVRVDLNPKDLGAQVCGMRFSVLLVDIACAHCGLPLLQTKRESCLHRRKPRRTWPPCGRARTPLLTSKRACSRPLLAVASRPQRPCRPPVQQHPRPHPLRQRRQHQRQLQRREH